MSGTSYRTQWGGHSFRIHRVVGDVTDRSRGPLSIVLLSRSPSNKILAGEIPFHGNRFSADQKSMDYRSVGRAAKLLRRRREKRHQCDERIQSLEPKRMEI